MLAELERREQESVAFIQPQRAFADIVIRFAPIPGRVAESLDLSGVASMLKRWQRVAWSTRDDPEAHRHMLACADELNAGGAVATESWEQTKARLSL